jgi:hypothetical protein
LLHNKTVFNKVKVRNPLTMRVIFDVLREKKFDKVDRSNIIAINNEINRRMNIHCIENRRAVHSGAGMQN